MNTAIVIHGLNKKPDSPSVQIVAPWLDAMGFQVLHFEYGRIGLIKARFFNNHLAMTLAGIVRAIKPRLIVSHSNGATLEHRALADLQGQDGQIDLLRIAPALDRDLPLPPCVHRCTVYYNAADWVVRLSEWIPFARYGSQGAFGPDSDDERFIRRRPPEYRGHSPYFGPDAESLFRPMFEKSVRKMLEAP